MALPLLKEPWLGSLLDAITTEYGKKFCVATCQFTSMTLDPFTNNLFRNIEESCIGS